MKRAALEARLRKESYVSISDRLGVSVNTVRAWVKEMTVTMLPQEEAEELRAHEVAGYDQSEQRLQAYMDMCAREAARREAEGLPFTHQLEQLGKFEEILSKVRTQRAHLLGINVPVQVKHNVTVRTTFDAQVEGLVSDLLGGGNVMSAPDMVDVGEDE